VNPVRRRTAALFGKWRNWKEGPMSRKLTHLWSDPVGRVLMALVLVGVSPIPAASAPRLLWHTEPQGG